MSKTLAAITAVAGWVPDDILSNQDLERMVDTTDEWITTRTGIKERRILKGAIGTSKIGIESVKQLLEKSGTDPKEIDLLICATITPDMQFPSAANLIADKCGLVNSFSYDIGAACSGFLYSLVTGAKFIEAGTHKKVIVVGADKMSSIIDYEDRTTCVIFGDGGGAVLLEPSTDGTGIQDSILHSDGSGAEFLHMTGGGSMHPASHKTVDERMHYVFQDGKTVFKFAVTKMAEVAEAIMAKNNLTSEDVNYLVAHQANKRIIDATARRMGIEDDKVLMNISRYGNTTSGTIPLLLWDYESKFKKGDNLIAATFGGGFTWGATYIKWSYDPK